MRRRDKMGWLASGWAEIASRLRATGATRFCALPQLEEGCVTTIISFVGPLAERGQLTLTGWRLPADLTAREWEQAGDVLSKVDQGRQWWLGDWWNAGAEYGDRKECCERLEIDYGGTANCAMVCKAFNFSRRREKLTFTHHAEVCVIDDPAVQDRMLDWCLEPLGQGQAKPRSTRELREQVRAYLDEQGWSKEERKRRALAESGLAIVVNQRSDERLLRWAQFAGRLVKVDRTTDWGNPFEVDKDGDRDYCCDCFETYFTMKTSLLRRLGELRGKVLACWCHPERCHAHHIAELANKESDT